MVNWLTFNKFIAELESKSKNPAAKVLRIVLLSGENLAHLIEINYKLKKMINAKISMNRFIVNFFLNIVVFTFVIAHYGSNMLISLSYLWKYLKHLRTTSPDNALRIQMHECTHGESNNSLLIQSRAFHTCYPACPFPPQSMISPTVGWSNF